MKLSPIIAKMIPLTAQDQMRNLLDSLNSSKSTHVSTKELLKKKLWNEWMRWTECCISYWITMHNNSFDFGISLEVKNVIGSTPLHCVVPRGFNYVTTPSHCQRCLISSLLFSFPFRLPRQINPLTHCRHSNNLSRKTKTFIANCLIWTLANPFKRILSSNQKLPFTVSISFTAWNYSKLSVWCALIKQ